MIVPGLVLCPDRKTGRQFVRAYAVREMVRNTLWTFVPRKTASIVSMFQQ